VPSMEMTPLEIVERLSQLKTDKSKEKLLRKIEPEHEFWISCYHGLRPFVPYNVKFGISDPHRYGAGVPLGVFSKILKSMEDGSLNDITTVDAISAFCSRCTEKEWKSWYRPVLDKRLRIPISLSLFNQFCPEQYRIQNFIPSVMTPLEDAEGFPESFYLEPYPVVPRLFLFLKSKRSFVFLEDGTPVHRLIPKLFERFVTREGAVLELYDENGRYTVRDILLEVQMLDTSIKTSFVNKRLEVLKTMISESESVEVIEHEFLGKDNKESIRDVISLYLEAGYSGVVLRPDSVGYRHNHANIVIHPNKKNTLTCTEIIPGEKGSKWEGRVEYFRGIGVRQGKKIDTLVFHGLTFDERGTSLEKANDLIGQKFEVLSCGVTDDGSLLFPVFQRWKENLK